MDPKTLLSGNNAPFLEELYEAYLADPRSVDPSWARLFAELGAPRSDGPASRVSGAGAADRERRRDGDGPAQAAGEPSRREEPALKTRPATPPSLLEGDVPSGAFARVSVNGAAKAATGGPDRADRPAEDRIILDELVARLTHAYRLRGHLKATLDPLGRPPRNQAPTLRLDYYGLNETHLDEVFAAGTLADEPTLTLRELLRCLEATYARDIGVEYLQLSEAEPRSWLQAEMERCQNSVDLPREEQRHILEKLSYAEGFEQFLHTKYVGAKRFSLSGEESLIPMIDALLEEAGGSGVREVVIGMAHRGRLNVLTNILGKAFEEMFSEFEKNPDPLAMMGSGDVKYHMGFSSDHKTRAGQKIHLSLAFNPSHLEAIDPVVLGRVRAKQERAGDLEKRLGLALLIHGDAAFAGQGIVPETLNLASLEGYSTGGSIHIVLNNQLGFTTFPEDSRSTFYATDVANMLKIPIFHVNADNPEAAVYVARLAMRFRQRFKKSVVIDLVGYRRYGHNETDEPTFTQPLMYKLISQHPPVRRLYAESLARRGRVSAEESDAIYKKCLAEFQAALDEARAHPHAKVIPTLGALWSGYKGGPDDEAPTPETAVPRERIVSILGRLSELPKGFRPHKLLGRFLDARAAMARGERPLDWSAGEALAFGSLLWDGVNVRLSGQDSRRGTFTHRHAVLSDVETGERHTPLANLHGHQGRFDVFDSPLSEAGVLGFEFGYSLDLPESLVIWEAQFGDFVNGAQVILDQFLSSSEDKWKRLSGLTLFLPHGYEGQGPEHSSARLERFLQLCAEDNWQIANLTTPAQLFHILRRQVLRPYRKPLVIFTPKSLLRHPEVISSIDDLAAGRFRRVLEDSELRSREKVRRLILCSGKVFYDLAAERRKRADERVTIARVEQLYPFPAPELKDLIASLPKLDEIYWVQEEPQNMGAYFFVAPRIEELTRGRFRPRFVGREASASPATGSLDSHVIEQAMIVAAAFRDDNMQEG
jgi:2-oxoglutarate dehydrogenase E1 component